jgi:ferredoxin like protein
MDGAGGKRGSQMRITDKLALDAFKNDKVSHIHLDQKICQGCKERFCIYACPANLYSLNEKGEMAVEFAGCLECGTCMIACIYGSIQWTYPQSGFGVQYRCG